MNINTTDNDLTINIDATTENNSKTNDVQDLWNYTIEPNKYQLHVTISSIDSTDESEETDDKVVRMKDIEKRKEVYGICGECNEPGTGYYWCQPCNAKRFKENFKSWTSGNKDIDELIQQSQLDAVCGTKCLEWVPFENFQDVTYITRGGFGKIYSANWPEGPIVGWNIENQKWKMKSDSKVALERLDNSSDISTDFLNEIKSHLQIYAADIISYFGITQDSKTKDYMMILDYCENGNLRNYESRINFLANIAKKLLVYHNDDQVQGNVVFGGITSFISDLETNQLANNKEQSDKEKRNHGMLLYIAPEILRGHQYTQAADIYSFGIGMNELISEEFAYNNIPHDHFLAIKICKGLRPKIPNDTPKLLVDLIMKCWDAKVENRPTSKKLYRILRKWVGEMGEIKSYHNSKNSDENNELLDKNNEIYLQSSNPLFKNLLLEPVNSEYIESLLSESDDGMQ